MESAPMSQAEVEHINTDDRVRYRGIMSRRLLWGTVVRNHGSVLVVHPDDWEDGTTTQVFPREVVASEQRTAG